MKKGILSVMTACAGAAAGAGAVAYQKAKRQDYDYKVIKKNEAILKMLNHWLKLKQEGRSLEGYFKENNYKKIAVYGLSYAGERLLDELKGTGIEVLYGIDRNADHMFAEVEVVSAEESLAPVDVIVVTAISYFDEIEEKLSEKVDCPIVSLEDIVYEV